MTPRRSSLSRISPIDCIIRLCSACNPQIGSLVTSNVVVHETITLLRMRLGYKPALQFGLRLLGETTTPIIRVTPDDEERAWAIFRRYPDKRFSFADCTSFAIMKRLGIGTAFAFDEDFRRFGKWIVEPAIEGN